MLHTCHKSTQQIIANPFTKKMYLELTTVNNANFWTQSTSSTAKTFDALDQVHALGDLAEDDVLAV